MSIDFDTAEAVSEDDLASIAQLGGAARGTPGAPGVSTTLTVTACDAVEAAVVGRRRVASVLLCSASPVAVEAVTVEQFDVRHGFDASEG